MQTTITGTPTEIDTQLAELYAAAQLAQDDIDRAVVTLRRALGQRQTWMGGRRIWTVSPTETVEAARACGDQAIITMAGQPTYADLAARYDATVAARTEIEAAQQTLEAEYVRRGRWSRFFSVEDGHIHSSMRCSTCNRGRNATRFGWHPELSGMSETDALANLAERAFILCTVCFPNAPVLPTAPRKTRDEIAAELKAAEVAARVNDPKLIAAPDGSPLRVDGSTIRTVRTAEIEYVNGLWWATSNITVGEPNEANAVRNEGRARQIAEALAAKNGTTPEAEAARLAPKVIKKIRKDFSPAAAETMAARWAAQSLAVTN